MNKPLHFSKATFGLLAIGLTFGASAADVAKIGETTYSSLADAISAARPNSTVTLLSDTDVLSAIPVNNDITLDLNGHTINNNVASNRMFKLGNATFTIEGNGGSVVTDPTSYGVVDLLASAPGAKLVVNGGDFSGSTDNGAYFKFRTDGQTVELNDVNASISADSGRGTAVVNATDVSVNLSVNGGEYNSGQPHSVFLNQESGNSSSNHTENSMLRFNNVKISSTGGPVVRADGKNTTITDCVVSAGSQNPNSWANCAVGIANGGEATISGGNYSGNYAAYIMNSGGKLTITDGTFDGTVQVDEKDDAHADAVLEIMGGTFNGKVNVQPNADCSISGGNFKYTDGLQEYAENGLIFPDSPNKGDYFSPSKGVATVNGTIYKTLEEAFTAASTLENPIVKLYDDVTVSNAIVVNNDLTLDLNGHTINNQVAANRMFKLGNATFTIEGNGGSVVTDPTSYGVVDLLASAPGAKLVVNGGDFSGSTDNGAYFKFRTDGQTVELNDVNASISADSGRGTAVVNATDVSVNLSVNGGEYNSGQPHSVFLNQESGNSSSNHTENSMLRFNNVKISSTGGPVVRADGKNTTITDCVVSAGSQNPNSWANCAVGIANGGEATISGGNYSGNYAAYIMNSGGKLTITDGTFDGTVQVDEKDDAHADAVLEIMGGTFNGKVNVQPNADCSISGGNFKYTDGLQEYCTNGLTFTSEPDADGYHTLTPTVSGVTAIEADSEADGTFETFTLQGVRVNDKPLTPGIYIYRNGQSVKKVIVK